ncbi:hypothetical protein ACFQYP_26695 [Nonomuraea antimicrobica]
MLWPSCRHRPFRRRRARSPLASPAPARCSTPGLDTLVDRLPGLLSVAHAVAEQDRGPSGYARLASCYELATDVLAKLGAPARRITADRATAYARLSGSQVAMASATRQLGIVLRHEGRHALADRVTAEAADHLEATGLTTPLRRRRTHSCCARARTTRLIQVTGNARWR